MHFEFYFFVSAKDRLYNDIVMIFDVSRRPISQKLYYFDET